MKIPSQKYTWKWSFTLVLLLNAVYIWIFYLIMQNFA